MKRFLCGVLGFLLCSMLILPIFLLDAGCTSNVRARKWGGSTTIELPAGRKLVNLTWKDANLWILDRPAKPGEVPQLYFFHEDSSWGILKGEIKIQEK